MGSATKHALAAVSAEIDRTVGAGLDEAKQYFDAVEVIAEGGQLRSVLADPAVADVQKRAIIDRVFGSRIGETPRSLLSSAVSQRWSSEKEFELGLQEVGVRLVSHVSGDAERVGSELLAIVEAVSESGELELTMSSKLTSIEAKLALFDRLFAARVSEPTKLVARYLIANPAGRRLRKLLTWAASIVADQAKRQVATVTVAKPLGQAQLDRLRATLSRKYNRDVSVAMLVDPAVIGGLRVQLGDDVIDNTIAARLQQLRLNFA